MTAVACAISYGMGGDGIDRSASGGWGEDYLRTRIVKAGIHPLNSVYNWYQIQQIVNDLRAIKRANPAIKLAVGGDSLGANETGDIAAALAQIDFDLDLVFDFQPSVWGKHTHITANVKKALIIYNPVFIETIGLGDYVMPLVEPPQVPNLYDGQWHTGNGGKTQVKYVGIQAPHPDDWGAAQDLAFHELLALTK